MNKYNRVLLSCWRKWLVIVFLYAIYHLIRDILQDILNIHNSFTEWMHYVPNESRLPFYLKWITFGGYSKWLTFPIEILLLLTIPRVWQRRTFVMLDGIIFSTLFFIESIWILNVYFS